ncbi:MAG: FMN-binding negative transcriptional regulator [Burkholderiaceae bacterium]
MYIPDHFAETRPEVLHALIRAHPLGALVTQGPRGLDANHLPFLLDAERGPFGTLVAHVARANPVWHEVDDGATVMVVFQSDAAGYISPNWYPSKHETHRQVPTWNYQVVHAHGVLRIRDDERFVRGVVARLTRTHEAGEPRPWKIGDSAPDYIDGMLAAIVGIEIDIVRLVGKSKLGQNREARDREGAVEALERGGRAALAGAMRASLSPKGGEHDE